MSFMSTFTSQSLPQNLQALSELALDLRWTWSHEADALWRTLDENIWERTKNPWTVLQRVSTERLQQLADDSQFCLELKRLSQKRAAYQADDGWYSRLNPHLDVNKVAYFSMEFGLGETLPIYAGGLGMLAGDYLKAVSDLGLPVVGVGLLYQQGYFRQMLDAEGQQLAIYPYNEPSMLPVQPLYSASGERLYVPLKLPGRLLMLRTWQVNVGRVSLYLLDSNDPLNSPFDRGITSKLYDGNQELRFLQELVLGIGGWRLLKAMDIDISVCHLNEGHAAFVVLERAHQYMQKHKCSFQEALWTTRAGNIFTTHTPVAAGFDTFSPRLIEKYFPVFHDFMTFTGLTRPQLLGLGRKDPDDSGEAFNMAYLAMRGCARSNGVSRLHAKISRNLFRKLYPRWPLAEIPVTHVTNGVHVPSWDSPWADRLWTQACGKQRWLGSTENLHRSIESIDDETLWKLRTRERKNLIHYARKRLALQLGQIGASPEQASAAHQLLDPNTLTLGFARRFATYKRPNLLLYDKRRLMNLLTDKNRPVQILIAGKAHPNDVEAQRMIQEWISFIHQAGIREHVIFLEDYDIALAQQLVQGIDVWINTPRRPWEACGTSGMKILVNGGLNLSALDGWWAEAYAEDTGWSIGDGQEYDEDPARDAIEAEQLYQRLEKDVIPLFYKRDTQGLPRSWLKRIRNSMMKLTPQFSSNRMVQEYVERFYHPAATDYKRRHAQQAQLAKVLDRWHNTLILHWPQIRFGNIDIGQTEQGWTFQVQVYLGEISPEHIRVELYADARGDEDPERIECQRHETLSGAVHGYCYLADIKTTRAAGDFTPRVIPYHPEAQIPAEVNLITWHR